MKENLTLVQALVARCQGQELDARYLGFFECFNRQLYFEAHEVLEELWLEDRQGAEGAFYKGLIQLAGAFVHLQKQRPGPAAALLRLARQNLANYPERHLRLNVTEVLKLIESWLKRLAATQGSAGFGTAQDWPELRLEAPQRTLQ